MKIVYLSPEQGISTNDNSGAGLHVREMIRVFREQGHEVLPIIAGDEKKDVDTATANATPRFMNIKKRLPMYIRVLKRDIVEMKHDRKMYSTFFSQVSDFSPDIIYERSSYLHQVGVKFAEALNTPRVLELNGLLVEWRNEGYGPALPVFPRRIERKKNNTANAIVVTDSVFREFIIEKGLPPEKLFVTGMGVDCQRFNLTITNGNSIRDKYAIADKIVVGFVGAFRRWHGVDILLKAACKVAPQETNIHFLIVGHGSLKLSYEQYIQEHNLSDRVTLTGEIPYSQVPDYISAMDITIVPNCTIYICPVKILEYGAMGKAIIAPRLQPIEDVMEDGKEGVLFTPESDGALAEAIIQLAHDSELRETTGKNFHNKVLNNFTWDIIGKKTLDIMEYVLHKHNTDSH